MQWINANNPPKPNDVKEWLIWSKGKFEAAKYVRCDFDNQCRWKTAFGYVDAEYYCDVTPPK